MLYKMYKTSKQHISSMQAVNKISNKKNHLTKVPNSIMTIQLKHIVHISYAPTNCIFSFRAQPQITYVRIYSKIQNVICCFFLSIHIHQLVRQVNMYNTYVILNCIYHYRECKKNINIKCALSKMCCVSRMFMLLWNGMEQMKEPPPPNPPPPYTNTFYVLL